MFVIDSLYVNNSGGLVLLKYLVNKTLELRPDVFFLIDSRCQEVFKHIPDNKKLVLAATYSNRLTFYKTHKSKLNGVLCFGNVPPPIRLKCKVYTYLHNPLLLATPGTYPFKQKVSKYLKTTFIKLHLPNTDGIFIQTSFMADLLRTEWKYPDSKTWLFPFYDVRHFDVLKTIPKKANEYLFINDGNPHKNHINLLKAWALVNEKQPAWRLHLTVTDRNPAVKQLIETYAKEGLNVVNHGFVNPADVYSICQYLVYPSLTESFGLGLMEGYAAGLQIIASDLPYAHSVVKPSATFDPLNPQNMADVILKTRLENPDFMATELKTQDMLEPMLAMFPR